MANSFARDLEVIMPTANIQASAAGNVMSSIQQAKAMQNAASAQLQTGWTSEEQNWLAKTLAQGQAPWVAQPVTQGTEWFDAQLNVAPRKNAWWHRERAEQYAKDGEKLIERIAFWSEVPLAGWLVSRLADELEAVSGKIESELAFR